MNYGNWRSCRGLMRILFAGTALMLLSASPKPAQAEDADIKELVFTIEQTNFPSTINVTSVGGNKWDTIMPGNVMFSTHMKVETAGRGYVDRGGIFLGNCENAQCGNGYPLVYFNETAARDIDWHRDVSFPTSKIPVSGPGIAVVPYGDEILKECNDHLAVDGPIREHRFTKQMTASFSVNTRKGPVQVREVIDPIVEPSFNGGEVTKHAQFTANVVCIPKPLKQTSQLQVGNIELFQSTYVNQTSRPNPATECKKVRVLVRLETNREGPVKFDLWTKIGDGPSTRKFIEAWASPDGGGYQAEYAEWVEVTKTTVVQSMAEDKTNPIGQSTGWKDITLHCTGVGGGGLADAPRQPTSSTPPQRLVAQTSQTPPTISCIGGQSTGSICICRQPTVKVQTGPNSYRCVMDGLTTGTGVAPQRLVGPANTAPPTISCIGGISTGTACFCRPPTVKVQTGPSSYRCVMDGMTTGVGPVGPVGPFGRVDNRPHFLVGPPSGQPMSRPMFNRQSALPMGGMMR